MKPNTGVVFFSAPQLWRHPYEMANATSRNMRSRSNIKTSTNQYIILTFTNIQPIKQTWWKQYQAALGETVGILGDKVPDGHGQFYESGSWEKILGSYILNS